MADVFLGEYSPEAHAGLAEMYIADERFTAYYDKAVKGGTKFLRDAIFIYTGKNIKIEMGKLIVSK